MTHLDSPLDPDVGVFDKRRLFSDRAVLTYIFVGLAIVVLFWAGMWGPSGYLTEAWSGGRILMALITALYGFGLGWIVFPRLGGVVRDL